MDDLDRLFHRLIQAIRASQPEALSRPFEIGELYTKLIPYRLHRRELQIETNQDYEAALIRLLSGERSYMHGDAGMQEFLRNELASPNPDTGVFREFSNNHVAIAPGALERVGIALDDAVRSARTSAPPPAETKELSTRPAPAPEPPSIVPAAAAAAPISAAAISGTLERSPPETAVAEEVVVSTPASLPSPASENSAHDMPPTRFTTASDAGGKCRYCSGTLPDGRRIVYCPHCGQNLTVHRCPACSTELEMGWKFCVTCGRSAGAAS